jgi:hypothetical protein
VGEHLEQPAPRTPVADPACILQRAPDILRRGVVAHPGGQLEVEKPGFGDACADVATAEILQRHSQLVGQVGHDCHRRHALASLDA